MTDHILLSESTTRKGVRRFFHAAGNRLNRGLLGRFFWEDIFNTFQGIMITPNFGLESLHLISICCSELPRALGRRIVTNLDVCNLVSGAIMPQFGGAGSVESRSGLHSIDICTFGDLRFGWECSGLRTRAANGRFLCRHTDGRLYRNMPNRNGTSPNVSYKLLRWISLELKGRRTWWCLEAQRDGMVSPWPRLAKLQRRHQELE